MARVYSNGEFFTGSINAAAKSLSQSVMLPENPLISDKRSTAILCVCYTDFIKQQQD